MGSHYHQTLCWAEYTLALVKVVLCPAIFIMLCHAVQWAGAESYSFAICSTTLLADFDLATACHQRYITLSWCYALLFSCYVVPRWQHYITRPNAMLRIDMLFSCNMFHRQHFIIPNNSLELFKLLRLFQTLFQPAGRRGEPILTGWHNLNKAALEDSFNLWGFLNPQMIEVKPAIEVLSPLSSVSILW